ncbi:MAG: hypothetical protein C4518_07765 [Desulfobacteraceae bacterium]|nr:MAG: hypothetical protein C4518_07765 [Desulfobacteraceae bacterium]
MRKLQGLTQLVQDAVDKSATAIEDVHLAVANEPLNILKKIPPLTPAVAGIQKMLNHGITAVYEIIRTVNRETGKMVSGVLGKFGGDTSEADDSGDRPGKKQQKNTKA